MRGPFIRAWAGGLYPGSPEFDRKSVVYYPYNPDLAKQLRVVWQSGDIPESPLVYRADLPLPLKTRLQSFVVNYGARLADEKESLRKMNNLTGFRKSSNAQLVNIADVEMFNARQRIINDTKITPEERVAKVDEVIRRGTRLELMLKLGKQ